MSELLNIKTLYYPVIDNFNIDINIKLNCNEINDNILSNLFKKIKYKYEKKCTKNGYVLDFHSIVKYIQNPISNEILISYPSFNVTLNSSIILPLKYQTIVCKLIKICPDILRCNFGPVEIICQINNEDFKLLNKDNISYININIRDIQYSLFDKNIKCLGNFISISSDDEIEKFSFKN